MQEMRAVPGRSEGGLIEVTTSAGPLVAKAAVNCCGSWSGAPVAPRKGHMLYVQPQRTGQMQHVVRAPDSYMVPRSNGKILLGTTVEDAGFNKSVMPATIQKLHAAAARYFPELAAAPVTATWTGLRPGSPDDLPLMGETETPGVFVASGHFRNGILLAPLTAQIMANLVMGKPPGMDISAFSPLRFAGRGR
ncbi:MAG: NAD(P)/FAD-dependent oxidoreductase, partial [Terriglobales bacterium]